MAVSDDDTAPAPAPLAAGDTVGRYRLEARIGGGGRFLEATPSPSPELKQRIEGWIQEGEAEKGAKAGN